MPDINVSFGANTAGVQQALALVKQTVNQTSVDMRQTFTTVNKSVTNVNTTLNETNNKFVTINKTVGEFKASMLETPALGSLSELIPGEMRLYKRSFTASNWTLDSINSKQVGTDEFGNKTFEVTTTWKASQNMAET